MHNLSNLFGKVLYMFRTGPLSIIRSISTLYGTHVIGTVMLVLLAGQDDQPTELAWQIPIACMHVQCWDTPDDGQWTCPKHVEYFISLAFIIRIYHDARPSECQM